MEVPSRALELGSKCVWRVIGFATLDENCVSLSRIRLSVRNLLNLTSILCDSPACPMDCVSPNSKFHYSSDLACGRIEEICSVCDRNLQKARCLICLFCYQPDSSRFLDFKKMYEESGVLCVMIVHLISVTNVSLNLAWNNKHLRRGGEKAES